MLSVTLSDGELAMAHVVATMRRTINAAMGIKNLRVAVAQSALDIDVDGVIGELAFAKAMNVYPDFVAPRAGGYDLQVGRLRLDVKATRLRAGRLLAHPTKAGHPDVDGFVLAIIDGPTVTFPGWARTGELMAPERLTDLGYGPVYALDQAQLRPFKGAEHGRVHHPVEPGDRGAVRRTNGQDAAGGSREGVRDGHPRSAGAPAHHQRP